MLKSDLTTKINDKNLSNNLNRSLGSNASESQYSWYFIVGGFLAECAFGLLAAMPLFMIWCMVTYGVLWLLVPFVVLFGFLIKLFYKTTFYKATFGKTAALK